MKELWSVFICCFLHSWRDWDVRLVAGGHGWIEYCRKCGKTIGEDRNYT